MRNIAVGVSGDERGVSGNVHHEEIFIHSDMIIFETARLIVRQYTADDADRFFLLNGDEEVMRHIRKTLNKEESDKFLQENIEFYASNPKLGRWAVEEKTTNKFVGSFALIPLPFDNEKDKILVASLKRSGKFPQRRKFHGLR